MYILECIKMLIMEYGRIANRVLLFILSLRRRTVIFMSPCHDIISYVVQISLVLYFFKLPGSLHSDFSSSPTGLFCFNKR